MTLPGPILRSYITGWLLCFRKIQDSFSFNLPICPHFSGIWERERKSVKDALRVVLGSNQSQLQLCISTSGSGRDAELKVFGHRLRRLRSCWSGPCHSKSALDAQLPEPVYACSQLTVKRHDSQILANHFWTSFIRKWICNRELNGTWWRTSSVGRMSWMLTHNFLVS